MDSDSGDKTFKYMVHGVTFTLKYAGRANKEFVLCLARSSMKHQVTAIIDDDANQEQLFNATKNINLDVMVESLLIGWSGLVDDNSKQITFTKHKAKELLTKLPDLVHELYAVCQNTNNFSEDFEKK
tara:strand:+ start:10495 stop:10875 length:381 start_codon:yes stop_codon:yes gene_type:complete